MASKSLKITYLGDASSVLRAQKQISSSNAALQTGVQRTAGFFRQAMGLAIPLSAAAAGTAIVKFTRESIQAAEEHQRTLAQLQLQVGTSTQLFEDQAAALEKLTGFQHDEVLAADTVLARLKLTGPEIEGLVPHILDFASAVGVSVPDAATTFEKALLGTARGLKVGGIAFKDTGTLAGNYAELEKLAEAATIKGSAALDTQAKAARELSSAWKDLKERAGTELLPIVTSLTKTLATLSTDVGPGVELLFQGVATQAHILAQNVEDVVGPIQWLLDHFPALASEAKDTGISFMDVVHAGQDIANPWNWNAIIKIQKAWRDLHGATDDAASGIAGAAAAAAGAQGPIDRLGDAVRRFADMSGDSFKQFKTDSAKTLNFVEAELGDLVSKANVTAEGILKAFDKALAAEAKFKSNSVSLLTEVQDRFPGLSDAAELMVADLADQGPKGAAVMAALADASDKQIGRILRDFAKAQGLADSFAGTWNRLSRLPDITKHFTTVFGTGGGRAHKTAHGFHGDVLGPTLFLAGEAGRERVDITPGTGGRLFPRESPPVNVHVTFRPKLEINRRDLYRALQEEYQVRGW